MIFKRQCDSGSTEVTEWKDLRAADEQGLRLKSRNFEKTSILRR